MRPTSFTTRLALLATTTICATTSYAGRPGYSAPTPLLPASALAALPGTAALCLAMPRSAHPARHRGRGSSWDGIISPRPLTALCVRWWAGEWPKSRDRAGGGGGRRPVSSAAAAEQITTPGIHYNQNVRSARHGTLAPAGRGDCLALLGAARPDSARLGPTGRCWACALASSGLIRPVA